MSNRASNPDPQAALLEQWSLAGLVEVLLPSGTWARLRIPEPAALVVSGTMPKELRAMALQFHAGQRPQGELALDMIEQFYLMARHLAADAVRQVKLPGSEEWVRVHLTAEQWDQAGLPPGDLAAVEAVCTARASVESTTAASRQALGLRPEPVEEEAAGTVGAFTQFRPDAGGAGAGSNGADVRPAAEQHAGHQGQPRGAGRGRRSRAAAHGALPAAG